MTTDAHRAPRGAQSAERRNVSPSLHYSASNMQHINDLTHSVKDLTVCPKEWHVLDRCFLHQEV